jgi:hypothetical protein
MVEAAAAGGTTAVNAALIWKFMPISIVLAADGDRAGRTCALFTGESTSSAHVERQASGADRWWWCWVPLWRRSGGRRSAQCQTRIEGHRLIAVNAMFFGAGCSVR